MKVECFDYKFPGMRKADSFIVYPNKGGEIVVQGARTIAKFDPQTRKGLLNCRGSNPKCFHHLTKFLGAVEYEFPADFVALALGFKPAKGDLLGSSEATGPVYIG